MSWRCDDTSLIAGAWVCSAYAGHGILAEDIPSTGEHGASVLYDQVTLPGDNGKEVRAEILTTPSGLTTWYQDEDGTVTASGPDGAYSYTIQVYVDGVALGSTKTVTLTFGAATVAAAIAGALGVLVASAQSQVIASAAITGQAGTLSASAGAGAVASAAMTGVDGTLSASSAGVPTVAIGGGPDDGDDYNQALRHDRLRRQTQARNQQAIQLVATMIATGVIE